MEKKNLGNGILPKLHSVNYLVLPDPALTPDENGLHLGGHHLETTGGGADDSQLKGHSRVGCHSTSLGVAIHMIGEEKRS